MDAKLTARNGEQGNWAEGLYQPNNPIGWALIDKSGVLEAVLTRLPPINYNQDNFDLIKIYEVRK